MTRFWSSDWHLGHHNIIKFTGRPFWKEMPYDHPFCGMVEAMVPDVEAMNRTIIDNTNDLVGADDELWLVGDIVMGAFTSTIELIKSLRCRNIYLIPGNHDRNHHMYPKWKKWQRYYDDVGITTLDAKVRTEVGGHDVLVCHFPYRFTHISDDRYSGLRPDPIDGWLIHGHTHAKERVDYDSRSLHVGVDAWDLCPISEDTVIQVIEDS